MLQILITMDLALDSDFYCPSIDVDGKYIDKIPPFTTYPNGIKCPCLNKIYNNHSKFYAHIKTKSHQSWLENINNNKPNLIEDNTKLQDTVKNQQLIIAKLEKELLARDQTIVFLSQQLAEKTKTINEVNNLLDFD